MASKQQDRQVRVGRDELEAPGRDHRDPAGFGDHGRWRAVAYCILDDGQERIVIPGLRVDHLGGRQPALCEPGRIKVAPTAHPQHRPTRVTCFTGSDASKKERGRGIVTERAGLRRNLMKRSSPQTAAGKTAIQGSEFERHDSIIRQRRRERAEARETFGQGLNSGRHKGLDSTRSLYVPLPSPVGQG